MVIFKLEQEDMDPPPPYVEDDDYDVYLFYPSISSRALVPTNGAPPFKAAEAPVIVPERTYSSLPTYQSSANDDNHVVEELDVASCCLAPLSSACASVSTVVLPEGDALERAGYSTLFRAGLASKSRKIGQRLCCLRRGIRKALEVLKLKSTG
ncbi:hypothetical protein PsYK624_159200 [Phanerochaete sordida]|uniref:Uncharacterized protein n=1 Tax=Phanerochaete sordida TaxID=48140 RepID=A0A9P3GUB8_9APHY|nr:hypothetical protein PsYK624_159200 [Phanerochaete sordida]